MGTRGFIAFVVDATEKTAYNHWDSYPQGLGLEVLGWLRAASDSIDALRERARALRVVDPDSEPTPADIARLTRCLGPGAATGRLDDWHMLLRQTEGRPHLMLEVGVIEDAGDFPLDSLYAEWGYVIDLDAETFEVYRGFQTAPHGKGRFAHRAADSPQRVTSSTYYPVALVTGWALNALPSDTAFLNALSGGRGDDEGAP
ncbi:hypothetical protein [Actinomadura keratinilytica]|uniref:Uncharacterized protein n=1 Tax=Actinomadura keratinilytica TaxID=547461 RepID=A0ABP7ZHY3_9ACTN